MPHIDNIFLQVLSHICSSFRIGLSEAKVGGHGRQANAREVYAKARSQPRGCGIRDCVWLALNLLGLLDARRKTLQGMGGKRQVWASSIRGHRNAAAIGAGEAS